MGNILIDLDATFGRFLNSYLFVFTQQNFTLCASLLQQVNSSLPSKARISNLPIFKINSRSLGSTITADNKAEAYCNRWSNIVWMAVAQYREEMLLRLDSD